MKLTPLDIQKHTFSHRMRGADPAEVESFLQLVSEDYEALLRERDRLKEQVALLEERVEELGRNEKMLQQTLVTAQTLSEDLKNTAMREAEIEHARNRILEMGSPFQDVMDQVEARLHTAITQMAESVKRNGRVVGKTKELGFNAIEQYQTLRALGGDRLHTEIETLRSALSTAGVEYKTDPEAVAAALETLADQTIEAAERVTRSVTPSRARMIDL